LLIEQEPHYRRLRRWQGRRRQQQTESQIS
jgi:hypothetical protein